MTARSRLAPTATSASTKKPMRYFTHDNDASIAFVEHGSGPPVVLIHGFPFDHTMWQAQIDALGTHCRVVAPDLRGFGQSTLSESDAMDGVEMLRYAGDVLATLDQLRIEESAILCGFSMGGYILWQFVLRYPERVRAIALCDTRARADSAEARAGRLKMAEGVFQSGPGLVAEAMLPKLLSETTRANRPEIVTAVDKMIRQADPRAIAAAQRGMARRPDVRGELRKIGCPALVLGGADDALSPPAEMREMAAALPDARFVEIPDAGHMTTMENPAAVSDALRAFVKLL